jgi:hypothetical protein
MQKGDQHLVSTHLWLGVDKAYAVGPEAVEIFLNGVAAKCHMMDALSALGDEGGDGRRLR